MVCSDDPAYGTIDESCGLWVSASLGDDGNPGTQAASGANLGTLVFRRRTDLAARLRRDLETAGVKREVLFESSETRQRLRAHDLRATFVTIHLAIGRTETWIMDRTGHRSSEMVNRYRRAARTFGELALGPLHAMDESIPEIAELIAAERAAAKSGEAMRECPKARAAHQKRGAAKPASRSAETRTHASKSANGKRPVRTSPMM